MIDSFHDQDIKIFSSLGVPIVLRDRIYNNDFSLQFDNLFFDDAILARTLSSLIFEIETIQKISSCIDLNWLTLLVGDFSSGMRPAVEILANLACKKLHILRLTAETDSLELLGSYEQVII